MKQVIYKKIKMSSSIKYTKLTEIDHTLHRPDTFIGSVKRQARDDEWVVDEEGSGIVKKSVTYSDGLIRIFMEIISNVIDNKWRSEQMGLQCKIIKVSIDTETGETQITNDGNTIPIELKEDDKYLPEMIFGQFRVSSN